MSMTLLQQLVGLSFTKMYI